MNDAEVSEAKYLLRKLLNEYGPALSATHVWVWESDRWRELVFALLTQTSRLEETRVREIAEELDALELLEISALADDGQAQRRRITAVLTDHGFTPEESRRAVSAIAEAALAFHQRFNGKVQHYLRRYGEQMLSDAAQLFRSSGLDEGRLKLALTYWLQNVLNMPLSLLDEPVRRFCAQNGLTPEALIAAADELDLNLALVDDLVQCALRAAEARQAQRAQQAGATGD